MRTPARLSTDDSSEEVVFVRRSTCGSSQRTRLTMRVTSRLTSLVRRCDFHWSADGDAVAFLISRAM